MSKRTTLTLSGKKGVIDQLEPGDIEVFLDVSNLPNDGIIQITKKNLINLNPDVNLTSNVNSIEHPEFVIKVSSILTDEIPIIIQPPLARLLKVMNSLTFGLSISLKQSAVPKNKY